MFLMPEGFIPPVSQLFALTSTSFDPAEFNEACGRIGEPEAEFSDNNFWSYRLHSEVQLLAHRDPQVPWKIRQAVMSFLWWESWSPSDHPIRANWLAERKRFDDLFEEELARAIKFLGDPVIRDCSDDIDGHEFAIWQGPNGLFVLQQSAHDRQFGFDLNYWIHRWVGPIPKPYTPLVDWLMAL